MIKAQTETMCPNDLSLEEVENNIRICKKMLDVANFFLDLDDFKLLVNKIDDLNNRKEEIEEENYKNKEFDTDITNKAEEDNTTEDTILKEPLHEAIRTQNFIVETTCDYGFKPFDVISVESVGTNTLKLEIYDTTDSPILQFTKLYRVPCENNDITVKVLDREGSVKYSMIYHNVVLTKYHDNGFNYDLEGFHKFKLFFQCDNVEIK